MFSPLAGGVAGDVAGDPGDTANSQWEMFESGLNDHIGVSKFICGFDQTSFHARCKSRRL